jgi:hypothetical protein
MTVHNFAESLERSHRAEDWPEWERIYREFFPDFASMTKHSRNGYWQAAGVDRSVTLCTGKLVLIDEKVRFRNQHGQAFEDIALETWSDLEKESPGWIVKPLLADYIAYAVLPLGRCHLFPVPQLQSAWRMRGAEWRKDYATIRVPNEGYWTECVCVPPDVLYRAIGSCFRTTFTPTDDRFEAP